MVMPFGLGVVRPRGNDQSSNVFLERLVHVHLASDDAAELDHPLL